jgi:hypothetical protein
MLLLGVPSAAGTVALLENRQFLIRIGIPIPQQFDWVSQASILFGTRVEALLVLIGVFGIPALGFIFGWWMGMHHSHPTQPGGFTGRRDYVRFVNRASLARRQ